MSERTEAPTGKRLHEARKEGQVARSVELNAAVALLMGAWLLRTPGKNLVLALVEITSDAITSLSQVSGMSLSLGNFTLTALITLAPNLAILVLGMLLTGVVVTVGQTGFLWASNRIGFDLNRLNPLNGLKRLVSLNGLVEFAKAILKLSIVGWVAYSFIRPRFDQMLTLGVMDFSTAIQTWAETAYKLMMRVGGVYLLLAIPDYAFQRWQTMRSLRMTKHEVKEEIKQREGHPAIRRHLRRQQRRMAMMRMMAQVPKADVVITNPIHFAVAVQYNPESMSAPKVLAKGTNHTARRIVQVARSETIPVVENVPLAQALYHTVEINEEIPPDLYRAMAEVLAYVYNLQEQRRSPVPIP